MNLDASLQEAQAEILKGYARKRRRTQESSGDTAIDIVGGEEVEENGIDTEENYLGSDEEIDHDATSEQATMRVFLKGVSGKNRTI